MSSALTGRRVPVRLIGVLALAMLGLALLSHPAHAAGGTVGSGSAASCTEAAFDAVYQAAQSSGGGVITFNCGAAPATLLFTYQKAVQANTELRGAGLITLSGQNATSLFQVYYGQTLTLDNMTLTRAYGQAGAVESFGRVVVKNSRLTDNLATGSGGALASYGQLDVTSSIFSGNSAGLAGGAIYVDGGTATVGGSQFVNNTATNAGGALHASVVSSLTVNSSQFTGNKVTNTFAQGGAVRGEGTVTVTGSSFAGNNGSRGGALSVGDGATKVSTTTMTGNWAAYGGAIRQEGGDLTLTDVVIDRNGYAANGTRVTTGGGGLSWGAGTAKLTNVSITNNWASYGGGFDHESGTTGLTNVTISGNAAVGGGGIDTNGGSIALTNVTIAGNKAPFNAGGVANRAGTVTAKNTLLSGNYNPDTQGPWNCAKALAGASFSLSSDFTCSLGAGRDGLSLPLRLLANSGGFTLAHLLQKGSPALDTATGLGCPATDQRGVARPQGTACDVGAVEMRPADFLQRVFMPVGQR